MEKWIYRLRMAGLVEGVSFILLMGIAMPLKYIWGQPLLVTLLGWVHGLLFMVFCLFLLIVTALRPWPLTRAALVFVAALLPFGPFLIDGSLRKEQNSLRNEPDAVV